MNVEHDNYDIVNDQCGIESGFNCMLQYVDVDCDESLKHGSNF